MNAVGLPRWATAVLVALALAGLIAWSIAARRGAAVRLPDGRDASVIAVTYGTNHHLAMGKAWFRIFRPFLSPLRAYALGMRSFALPTPTASMMVWVQWREFATNPAPSFLTVVDRHGVECEPIFAALQHRHSTNGHLIMAWPVANYPRTQRTVQLRFYQPDRLFQLHRVAELPVRNPARVAPARELLPPPPLIVVGRDGREFSLLSLDTTGTPPAPSLQGPSFQLAPWTTARLGVRERGSWSPSWRVTSLEASSAGGNHFARPFLRAVTVDGQVKIAFQDVLWADDPGWKLRVEFMRTRGFDFPPAALWTLASLPVQTGRQPFQTNLQAVVNGAQLRWLQLAVNPGIVRREPGGYRRTTETSLRFTCTGPRLRAVLTRVVDERGRELKFGDGHEESPGAFIAGLEIPPDTRSVDLTFAFHPGELIDFDVPGSREPPARVGGR